MSYAESLLATDERILYRGRQHWLAPFSDARNAVLLVLAGLVLWFLAVSAVHPDGTVWQVWGGLVAVLIVVGLAWIAKVYLSWKAAPTCASFKSCSDMRASARHSCIPT